jgi:hypothetical protein
VYNKLDSFYAEFDDLIHAFVMYANKRTGAIKEIYEIDRISNYISNGMHMLMWNITQFPISKLHLSRLCCKILNNTMWREEDRRDIIIQIVYNLNEYCSEYDSNAECNFHTVTCNENKNFSIGQVISSLLYEYDSTTLALFLDLLCEIDHVELLCPYTQYRMLLSQCTAFVTDSSHDDDEEDIYIREDIDDAKVESLNIMMHHSYFAQTLDIHTNEYVRPIEFKAVDIVHAINYLKRCMEKTCESSQAHLVSLTLLINLRFSYFILYI